MDVGFHQLYLLALSLSFSSFLGVAEGLVPGVPAGVEEVTAIATLQALHGPENAKARLVRLPQVSSSSTAGSFAVPFHVGKYIEQLLIQ